MDPLATALLVGLLVGLAMGALGGGGGIVTVPALVHLLGLPPAEAATTSLVIVGITALVGVAQHGRAGRVRWREGLLLAVLGLGGSVLGSLVGLRLDPAVLMTAFGLLLLVVATLMWRRAAGRSSRAPGPERERRGTRYWATVLAVATGVGLLTGFFGVGGGFAIVPALVLVLGVPMAQAVGTSLLVIALSSAASLVVRAGGTDLDWRLVAVFTAAAVATSLVGGRLTTRVPAPVLQRSFAGLLVVVALLTLARSVPAL